MRKILFLLILLSSLEMSYVSVSNLFKTDKPVLEDISILEECFPDGIKGMSYQPCPTDYFCPSVPVKYGNTDFANSDFQALWGKDNKNITRNVHFYDGQVKKQGDLKTLADLGVNLIRLYNWQSGNEGGKGWVDHTSFLDECKNLGIYVIVPVFITPDSIATSTFYKNLDWLVKSTVNHPAVVFYSIGNEIAPNPSNANLWNNIKLYSLRVRELIDQYKGKQLIISPSWGSEEVVAWFLGDVRITKKYDRLNKTNNAPQIKNTGKIPIDAWAFNMYDVEAMQKIFSLCSHKCISDMPVIISEYGTDAYNNLTNLQDQDLQNNTFEKLFKTVLLGYQNSQIYGGIVFEFCDERYKGFPVSSSGGNEDVSPIVLEQSYLQQVGGLYYTYENGPHKKLPKSLKGNCTYGWELDWIDDKSFNEGYVGISYLVHAKEAKTTLNGASVKGKTIPWIYRVDDLYLRKVSELISLGYHQWYKQEEKED